MDGIFVEPGFWNSSLWNLLRKNVYDRKDKIDVWYETPAVRLIQDPATKIIHGVVAQNKGAKYNTGDEVKMAIDVGADLWHMSTLAGPDVNFINPNTGRAQFYGLQLPVDILFSGLDVGDWVYILADGSRIGFAMIANNPLDGTTNTAIGIGIVGGIGSEERQSHNEAAAGDNVDVFGEFGQSVAGNRNGAHAG